jgi:hypothetical protein
VHQRLIHVFKMEEKCFAFQALLMRPVATFVSLPVDVTHVFEFINPFKCSNLRKLVCKL